jgi:tellurite resistance protein
VLLHGLYTVSELPAPLCPTLGIQLVPPAVGCGAYLSITSGPPDQGLIGPALFPALQLIQLIPSITRHPLAPSYWAFTLGLAALAPGPISSAAP